MWNQFHHTTFSESENHSKYLRKMKQNIYNIFHDNNLNIVLLQAVMYLFRPSDQAQSESMEFYFKPNNTKIEQSQIKNKPIVIKSTINKPNLHMDCIQKQHDKDNMEHLSSKIIKCILCVTFFQS